MPRDVIPCDRCGVIVVLSVELLDRLLEDESTPVECSRCRFRARPDPRIYGPRDSTPE
jgi:hypothetical protein